MEEEPEKQGDGDGGSAGGGRWDLLNQFVMRGMVVLGPAVLGVPPSLHRTVLEKEKRAVADNHQTRGGFILLRVPEVVDVINSPVSNWRDSICLQSRANCTSYVSAPPPVSSDGLRGAGSGGGLQSDRG